MRCAKPACRSRSLSASHRTLFLTPAMLMLFGRRTWSLPGFLDRIVPDLDLEGNKRAIPDGVTVESASSEVAIS
jgi:hypothetical protein